MLPTLLRRLGKLTSRSFRRKGRPARPHRAWASLQLERLEDRINPADFSRFALATPLVGDTLVQYGFLLDSTSTWYTWTAQHSGPVQFNTFTHNPSPIDTTLDVYTGDSPEGLTPVASNDDAGGTLESQVVFNATAGTTYRIAVSESAKVTPSAGFQEYQINLFTNDHIASAAEYTTLGLAVSPTNMGATGLWQRPDQRLRPGQHRRYPRERGDADRHWLHLHQCPRGERERGGRRHLHLHAPGKLLRHRHLQLHPQ